MRPTSPTEWRNESQRLLELVLSAYEIAMSGLTAHLPTEHEFWFGSVTLSSKSDVERLEREVSDAFFLRLKGLFEAQMKRLPGAPDPNWKSADTLLKSIGVPTNALLAGDSEGLGNFCAIRNCIAHNDGRVDEVAAKRVPNLRVGSDIWMSKEELRNWFRLCGRIVQAVGDALETSGA